MRTLRLHAKGDDVGTWQAFLRDAGFYEGAIDGTFTEQTEASTRAFQRANSLKDDGVVGNITFGTAMRLGLDLAPEDPPLTGGPRGGVTSMNDAWEPPPPPIDSELLVATDPRVITDHQAGQLPCPGNPPPPVGWLYWQGPVPQPMGELAAKVEFTPARFPMGTFVQALVGGRRVAARVEWHNYQGATGRHGCFRGTSLFRPKTMI